MPEDIFWKKYAGRFRTYPGLIHDEINPDIRAIICIPVCAEPDLLQTLQSLIHCQHSNTPIEVILLFNRNEWMTAEDEELHDLSWNDCLSWISNQKENWIQFRPVYVKAVPDPKGGVGWARKLAMDEASRRLDERGILICLDADCRVESNYLEEIIAQFDKKASFEAASIYFEHSLDTLVTDHREAIITYELHLRYLVHAQQWCGHPFAFHTVGSSMAVKRNAYLSQGGMNTKQAGEDFYFLQKFIENEKLFEIKNTAVYPSARPSKRVPFGTGKAMHQINSEGKQWMTADFEIFRRIKPLFESVKLLWELCREELPTELELMRATYVSEEVIEFLKQINFVREVKTIALHTSSFPAFQKRFYRYFNAFMMIRYMHYMRDRYFPDVTVLKAIQDLWQARDPMHHTPVNAEEYLKELREQDRGDVN